MSYLNNEDFVHIDQYGELEDRLVEAQLKLKEQLNRIGF